MTREEAIKLAEKATRDSQIGAYGSFPDALIDTLIALDLLKLDDEQPYAPLAERLSALLYDGRGGPRIPPTEIRRALLAGGLDLIEKKS